MGEEIRGAWLDKRTGKTIFVDDIIMDGDTMVVRSSIGMLDGNMFGEYFIKMSDEDYGTTGVTPEVSQDQIMATINKGIDADLRIEQVKVEPKKTPSQNKKQTIEKKQPTEKETEPEQKKSSNYDLIDKVFKKMTVEPEIEIQTNLNDWPVNELKMLINVFDVSIDEVSDYIVTKCLSKNTLIGFFNEYFRKELENK